VPVLLLLGALLGVFLLIALVALGGGFIAGRNSESGRIRRALRAAPAVSIAEAPLGVPIKLVGRLSYVGEPLLAPFSKRKCAAWSVVVKTPGPSSGSWWTSLEERKAQSFQIEDETGRALVELGDDSGLAIVIDFQYSSDFLRDPAPHLEAFVRRRRRSSRGILFNKSLRYREGVLREGETVAVLGVLARETDPDPSATQGYREKGKRAPSGGRLLMSDQP
jgi:hypothetical protein